MIGAPFKRALAIAFPLGALAAYWLFGQHGVFDLAAWFSSFAPHDVLMAGLSPAAWGFQKLDSVRYPLAGAASSHSPQKVTFDVKDSLKTAVVASLFVRVVGNVVKVGAAAGTGTGRTNPESLITGITCRSTPSIGVVSKAQLSARGLLFMGYFHRGFIISESAVSDAAETIAVDIKYPLVYRMREAVKPIEFGLPLSKFQSYNVEVTCGGREQLFTGGTPPTWDFSNLSVELWADYDDGIGGSFHLLEEFEEIIEVTQSKTDLRVILPDGYVYTDMVFWAERDNVLATDIINNISIESAARSWLPMGDQNAVMIRRWNNENLFTTPQAANYVFLVPGLRDGMVSRAFDMTRARPDVKLDVTLGAGTTRRVIVHGRRIVPGALKV